MTRPTNGRNAASPRLISSYLADGDDWGGTFRYGPHTPDERTVRLLGPLAGKRVLLLGCGAGQPVRTLTRAGAKVITVEPSAIAAQAARQSCATGGVLAEIHQHDLAELAFVRADTIDLVVSPLALAGTDDLIRVFRQLHRVLKSDSAVVASLPHPFLAALEDQAAQSVLTRSYWPVAPRGWQVNGIDGLEYAHRFEDIFVALSRTNFRVDTLLEPQAVPSDDASPFWRPALAMVPPVMIFRARKIG